ncbi:hypothetical protein EDB81DRAFT_874859 [Dactylonectria macrodidyma]|uniref:Uncharacterized protein n=1 Tax=Dactylonectria macrodidyma TaxID=307937 RepID=A0A9P9FU69_9HYPO|nr:hypothetical protein EDB81DRAFT_874859 [Dactylonectria macrodidyma]
MPETNSQVADSTTPKGGVPKDKTCPYCGQAFTSSSLSRHLDLYIKEKNPKAPDGIHDADAIRKLREGITRRRPIGGRRESSTPLGTSQSARKRDAQKRKLTDAKDNVRATELALRELLSCKAAGLQLDINSMPFDFNPLSLDFPALTLQCLQPPPTLFSSTQHPTSTSWSIQSPRQRVFDALRSYFQTEFQTRKPTCTSATASTAEELTLPLDKSSRDAREATRNAEKTTEHLEAQFDEHLQSTYTIEQLNQLQKPRGVKSVQSMGIGLREPQLMSESIERSKNVIISTRADRAGMNAQRSLDQTAQPVGEAAINGNALPTSQTQVLAPTTPQVQTHQPPAQLQSQHTNGGMSENSAGSTSTTAPPSVEEMSDQSADAEMEDDDSFVYFKSEPLS